MNLVWAALVVGAILVTATNAQSDDYDDYDYDFDGGGDDRLVYHVEAFNTNSCVGGNDYMETESQCRYFAWLNGYSWGGKDTWSDHPKGCFIIAPSVYFNTHSSGGSHKYSSLICWKGGDNDYQCQPPNDAYTWGNDCCAWNSCDSNGAFCNECCKPEFWGQRFKCGPNPTSGRCRDSDACLSELWEHGNSITYDQYDCLGSAEWCSGDYARDMLLCCPLTCQRWGYDISAAPCLAVAALDKFELGLCAVNLDTPTNLDSDAPTNWETCAAEALQAGVQGFAVNRFGTQCRLFPKQDPGLSNLATGVNPSSNKCFRLKDVTPAAVEDPWSYEWQGLCNGVTSSEADNVHHVNTISSLEACQGDCEATTGCTGVSYHADADLCRVYTAELKKWTHPEYLLNECHSFAGSVAQCKWRCDDCGCLGMGYCNAGNLGSYCNGHCKEACDTTEVTAAACKASSLVPGPNDRAQAYKIGCDFRFGG